MLPDPFKNITHFIFDVDGVLTDGMVLVLENGLQARLMNTKDGYALQLAIKKGYRILIVSGALASPVTDRLNKLGITEVHMAVTDKRTFVLNYIETNGLDNSTILFMGDDMPDLPVMDIVGLATAPADAIDEMKHAATYISSKNGGKGCVRDVIERVLKARGDWMVVPGIASR